MAEVVDVAVVGAGPAGLAAASEAARLGLEVLLVDEQPAPGGQVWRAADRILADDGVLANLQSSYDRAGRALEEVRAAGIRHVQGATLFDVAPDLELSWLERTATGHAVRSAVAGALIVATGAMERPVPFAGWTLPGVMGIGALQTALKLGGLVPEEGGFVLAGQGPLLLLYTAQLEALGSRPAAILDIGDPGGFARAAALLPTALASAPALMGRGMAMLARRALARTRTFGAVRALAAVGDGRVEAVRFSSGGGRHELPCSLLGVHDGVIPEPQLARLLGLEHRWNPLRACFEPVTDAHGRSSTPRVWVAGDAGGVEGEEQASLRGRLAALDAARALDRLERSQFQRRAAPLVRRRRAGHRARGFLDRLYAPTLGGAALDDATIVCRCEALTAGELRRAVRQGATGPNRVKTFTRCGMGPCQGRLCGLALTRLVAETTGRSPDAVGALRVRPPLKPILLGDFVGDAAEA